MNHQPRTIGRPQNKKLGKKYKLKHKHQKDKKKLTQEEIQHREEVEFIKNRMKHVKPRHRKHHGPKDGEYKNSIIQQPEMKLTEQEKQALHVVEEAKKENTNNTEKRQIILDSDMVLSFINLLVQKGYITKEEIQKQVLNDDNPLKHIDIKLVRNGRVITNGEKIIDHGSLRGRWIQLMRESNLYCCLCGYPITTIDAKSPWRLTAEHTQPKSKKGKSDSSNLLPAHSICNSIKTNILPQTWEKVGYDLLRARGIKINNDKVSYLYPQLQNQR